jgi:hypothetical protein
LALQFLIGIAGAALGALGWLLVGMFMQRREHRRQAINCGRAIYFELGANRLTIFLALEYGTFGTLSRSTFDTFLPHLATWLSAVEVQTLVLAYLGHAGYVDLAQRDDLPIDLRRTALVALSKAHEDALDQLKHRVFSSKEVAALEKRAAEQQAHLLSVQGPIPDD